MGLPPNVAGTGALRARLRELTGLPDDASPDAVTLAVHRRLAEAPSVLLAATLEDALGVAERPNLPGTTGDRRANWSLALPVPMEGIQTEPACRALAGILGSARLIIRHTPAAASRCPSRAAGGVRVGRAHPGRSLRRPVGGALLRLDLGRPASLAPRAAGGY